MSHNFFIHESSYIGESVKIGVGSKIWHFCHIMDNSVLGKKCNIGQNVVISPGVVLGNNVKVQNNVSVYSGVVCEDDVFLGPSMVFTNVINPRSTVNRRNEYLKTLVKKGSTIGANATIICGTTIGEFSFVGAGAVVTKDIKDLLLLLETQRRQIGWMSKHGERLTFNSDNIAYCKATGNKIFSQQ